ncbi:MAG: metallophosphoesterase [Candidatus Paceibacterota bacterium]
MKKITIAIIFVLLFLFTADVFYEVNFPKVNLIEIETDKIKAGEEIKIVQITDLHNKKFLNNQIQIYDKIKEINPDFIVLTGDMIDRNTKNYSYVYSFIDELLKINSKIYYVSGNHELDHEDVDAFNNEIAKRGVDIIDSGFREYKDIDIYGTKYYNNIPLLNNQPRFSLLLIHDQSFVINSPDGFNLILSGHTHGGQTRVPFAGAVYAPGQGLFPKYSKGLFKIKDSWLYIDSGLGNTFLPVRFLNQSQISFIKINSK